MAALQALGLKDWRLKSGFSREPLQLEMRYVLSDVQTASCVFLVDLYVGDDALLTSQRKMLAGIVKGMGLVATDDLPFDRLQSAGVPERAVILALGDGCLRQWLPDVPVDAMSLGCFQHAGHWIAQTPTMLQMIRQPKLKLAAWRLMQSLRQLSLGDA